MARIVTYAHRYKRPARKKPPVALEVRTVVTRKRAAAPRKRRRLSMVAQLPRLDVMGQRNQAHRAMRNVTAP